MSDFIPTHAALYLDLTELTFFFNPVPHGTTVATTPSSHSDGPPPISSRHRETFFRANEGDRITEIEEASPTWMGGRWFYLPVFVVFQAIARVLSVEATKVFRGTIYEYRVLKDVTEQPLRIQMAASSPVLWRQHPYVFSTFIIVDAGGVIDDIHVSDSGRGIVYK